MNDSNGQWWAHSERRTWGKRIDFGDSGTPLIPTRSYIVLFLSRHERNPPSLHQYLLEVCELSTSNTLPLEQKAVNYPHKICCLSEGYVLSTRNMSLVTITLVTIDGDYKADSHISWRSLSFRKWCRIVGYINYRGTCCHHFQRRTWTSKLPTVGQQSATAGREIRVEIRAVQLTVALYSGPCPSFPYTSLQNVCSCWLQTIKKLFQVCSAFQSP
jgi:hypothetical protein